MRVYYGYTSSPSNLLQKTNGSPPPILKVMSNEPSMDFYTQLQELDDVMGTKTWSEDINTGYLALIVELDGRHLCSYHTVRSQPSVEKFNARFPKVPLGPKENIQLLYFRAYGKNTAYNPEDINSPQYLLQKPPETCPEDELTPFKSDDDYKKFVAKRTGVLDLGIVNIDFAKTEKARNSGGDAPKSAH